jgi:hypothetical protein
MNSYDPHAAAHRKADPPPLRLALFDDVIRAHPGLSVTALRSLIAHAADNGLAAHLYRPTGRRGALYIDLNGFESWMREHGEVA